MVCPKCGAQTNDTARFCLKCGNPIGATVQSDNANNTFVASAIMDDDSEKTVFAQSPVQPPQPAQQFTPPVQPQQPAQQFTPPVQPQQPAQQFTPPVQPQQPAQQFTPPVQPQQYAQPIPEYPAQYSQVAQPAKGSGKTVGIIIAVILILLALGGGIFALFATGVIGGSDNFDEMFDEADGYMEDKEYDKAIEVFEDILDEDETNADAYLGIAKAYEEQGDYDKAIKTLEDALKDIEDEDDIKDIEKQIEKLKKKAGNGSSNGTGEADDTEEAGADETEEPGTTTTTTSTSSNAPVDVTEPDDDTFNLSTVYGDWCAEYEYTDSGTYNTPTNVTIDSYGVAIEIIDVYDLYYSTYELVMTEDGFYIDDIDNGYFLITFTYDYYDGSLDMNFYDNTGIDSDFYLEEGLLNTNTSYNEGDVLNIWCWNDEFKTRMEDFYPGYYDMGNNTGMIGDVTVKWTINPNADNGYQIPLDAALMGQDYVSDDEKIDIFLIEADYADKYVNSSYSLPVSSVGITSADTSEMYSYTKEIATDSNGNLKAVAWQACPGLFAYKRSIAKAVLGTDDPAVVQSYVANWDKFDETAKKMKNNGYYMLSTYDDAYRVFSNNVSAPWVNSYNEIIIDDSLWRWVEQTKTYTEKGYNRISDANSSGWDGLWSDNWANDQSSKGKVFGFFYSTWGINFTLLGNAGNAGYGDWAVCYGPESFYWGGTWLCAGYQTDNPTLVHDIMYNMTCNGDIMEQMTRDPAVQDYTNNMAAMERIASDPYYGSGFLGGQNHIALFTENAKNIDMSNISPYDQGLNETFQTAFKEYFDGYVDKNTALENFYKAAIIKYPELSRP